jgi:uncharacterized membrane protein YdbT with pleckstrin-like domain
MLQGIETSLGRGEALQEVVEPHWAMLVRPFLLTMAGVAIGLILVVYFPIKSPIVNWSATAVVAVAAAYFAVHFVSWRHEFMVISTKRVILQRGVVTRSTREIPLHKISDVTCRQSLLGRMIGFGSLDIDAEHADASEQLRYVAHPVEVRALLASMAFGHAHDDEETTSPSGTPNAPFLATASGVNLVDELERLTKLYRDGFINLDEFERSKKHLLGGAAPRDERRDRM